MRAHELRAETMQELDYLHLKSMEILGMLSIEVRHASCISRDCEEELTSERTASAEGCK